MLALHERYVIDATGRAVEVILPITDYRALLERLRVWEAEAMALPSWNEWSAEFRQALAEAGHTTREQMVALTREVRREQADERQAQ